MKPMQRVLFRLPGETVECQPILNQHLTFAAYYCNIPLRQYYLDFRAPALANRAIVVNFGADLFQAISDPDRETADLGGEVEFHEDNLPISKILLIRMEENVKKQRIVVPEDGRRISGRLGPVRLMKTFGDDCMTVGGPRSFIALATKFRMVLPMKICAHS
ncbi:MAG TPA: hypothetical protein VF318_05750 [Dehalococcoidales bacterium]